MNVPRSIFREYDVRGIIGKELTPEFAHALGRAYAGAGWEKLGRAPVLAVGRDNRPSGSGLAAAVRAGIVASGGTAIDVGMMPTPALYFAVTALGTDGGMQVDRKSTRLNSSHGYSSYAVSCLKKKTRL